MATEEHIIHMYMYYISLNDWVFVVFSKLMPMMFLCRVQSIINTICVCWSVNEHTYIERETTVSYFYSYSEYYVPLNTKRIILLNRMEYILGFLVEAIC